MSEHKIPLAGVIGCPISHSKSPRLHGHWLKTYGIAGHYVHLHIEKEDFPDALRNMPKLGFVGCNVTIPYKIAALEIADVITDRASMIGAANTLTFRDGKIYADNTDGYGFTANVWQGEPDWKPDLGPALVLGAGGAARAIIVALLDSGVPEIILTNRTRANAEALRSDFGAKVRVVEWVNAGDAIADAHTIVNTTSLGMKGGPEFKVNLDKLRADQLVTDIVYTPLRTHLLNEAEKAGCRTVDGLGMLLHQAVPGFERWFGKRPEVTEELRQLMLAG
ncbi:shikimate dehydrogenase [Marivivens niveibacter]|uniref:Shikimate dehydrogenase (NADP(+)) n=1 Tax=Marivivens niveibacter TaxID=1930667 RepID=A0A251WYZ5_9RHOB|nr:shikimate dehydrogenase [Marivivens niveibacter]OUD09699.1 shikimate dehydrogenase [Marivivens niveibacter]